MERKIVALVLIALTCSSCGVITGVRKVDAWGLKMDFAEGLDVHAGANSIDRVDDRRGILPMGENSQTVKHY